MGIHYNPLSKNFKLNSDISVNYLFYARKPT
jgi:2-polyprenyl-3-methyl-5-hydroxy-6-metoxy-1,4-benzoquinol methylase